MDAYGEFKKRIMIIGEAPGQWEDKKGKPWQGKTGRLLRRTLEKLGVDLFQDCLSINSVNCRPPENRTPTGHEINCCRDVKVLPALLKYKPSLILLLGSPAIESFMGHRWKQSGALGGITKWRGWQIPDQDFNCWVCPTFHPSYVERMDSKEVNTVWEQDLNAALIVTGVKFPKYNPPHIQYIKDLDELEINTDLIAFDYEATGIKPHRKGHKIVCASIAVDENMVYTFPIPKRRSERKKLIEILKDKSIKKIGANIKYEEEWTKVHFRTSVNNWHHDTVLTAHNLDNRSGITSVKFQTYVRLGIIDYDSEVSPYLKSTTEEKKQHGDNGFNRILELVEKPGGMEKLLEYCALDSINEYRIAKLQMIELELLDLPF